MTQFVEVRERRATKAPRAAATTGGQGALVDAAPLRPEDRVRALGRVAISPISGALKSDPEASPAFGGATRDCGAAFWAWAMPEGWSRKDR